MKPIPLKVGVKSRARRIFCYCCLGIITGALGIAIARVSLDDYQANDGSGEPLFRVMIGFALPLIFVVGEITRFRMWCGKIPAVMCDDCSNIFDIEDLLKTGKCPQCQSKRVVGIKPDDNDPIVSLYE